jgi:hypothetical protein
MKLIRVNKRKKIVVMLDCCRNVVRVILVYVALFDFNCSRQ